MKQFELQEGELIKDVIADVLWKNPIASNIISLSLSEESDEDQNKINVNVFRYKQSLDDPTLLFWGPWAIVDGEWPFIFLFKLDEGKVVANTDLGSPIQMIDTTKVN